MGGFRSYFTRSSTDRLPEIAICLSGTGSNAEKLLEQAAAGKVNYKVAVLFTDAPKTSRALELGKIYQLPVEQLDIREFYREHGEDDIRLNTSRRRELRELWTQEVWKILEPYHCDFAVFAGFVPLSNLSAKLPCLNVHPGDLTVEKDGVRCYAGLHCEPVERAILDGRGVLRSSVILVQSYSGDGKTDMDGGAILGISSEMPIDLEGYSIEELDRIKADRTTAPYKDELRRIALKNIEALKVAGDHVVLPQVVDAFAAGCYCEGKNGALYFSGNGKDFKEVETVEFSADASPEPRKRTVAKKISRNKLFRFLKYLYVKMVRDKGTPDYIARGWALGMFVGCVIPVFCQLIIAIPLSFVFRGSKIGAALGTFITTPPTAVFIYPVQIWLGNKIICGNLASDSGTRLLEIFNSESLGFVEKWSAFGEMGTSLVAAFFAGGIAWALVMTPLTYFGVRQLVVRYRRIRERMLESKKKTTA